MRFSAGKRRWVGTHRAAARTWYVLSKVSYMNLVINDVFPTAAPHAHTAQNVLRVVNV